MDEEVDAPPVRCVGGVTCRMRVGAEVVTVMVSDHALDDRELAMGGEDDDRLAIFGRHRDAIVVAARRSLDQHLREKDGTVLIRTADLNS